MFDGAEGVFELAHIVALVGVANVLHQEPEGEDLGHLDGTLDLIQRLDPSPLLRVDEIHRLAHVRTHSSA